MIEEDRSMVTYILKENYNPDVYPIGKSSLNTTHRHDALFDWHKLNTFIMLLQGFCGS